MGFNSVFRSLQEVFPQVDIRMLKAVAIEHSKDADAAVECILFEVLPYLPNPLDASRSPSDSWDAKHPTVGGVEPAEQKRHELVQGACVGSPLKSRSVESENANDTVNAKDATYVNSMCLNEEHSGSSVLNLHGGNDRLLPTSTGRLRKRAFLNHSPDQLCTNTETEKLVSLEKLQKVNVTDGSDQGLHVASSSLIQADTFATDCCNGALIINALDLNEPVAYDSSAICGERHQDKSFLDTSSLEVENFPATVQLISLSHEETSDPTDSGVMSEKSIVASISECEKPRSGGSSENASELAVFDTEMIDVENESFSTDIVTQSGQVCRMDLLEDSIGDAKDNKKTLFSAMESVINMMKDMELQQEAVKQAKEEAARGGLDILAKAEDLRQMLRHAKEANDMHAGEVYGERAILATEMRELQSRILNLSDERNNSLAILDEMRQTLEAQLTAAEEERKAAEQEKLEKENSARKALTDQELAMEKVVQESKILQQEAEENSKLRDFLMDRGRIVDILQGEIAVICQDVKLLKEKFDDHVPISKSLSSSQTSCILASSSSSIKSLASDQVPEQVESSEAMEKTSPAPSMVGQLQNSHPEEKKTVTGDNKVSWEDEWELFDKEAALYN